jgi:hypothetical protein
MKIIAIDPGVNGGIAWHIHGRNTSVKMPETEAEILAIFQMFKAGNFYDVVIERINGFIPSAGSGMMFTFGEDYGFLRGLITGLGFNLIQVQPKAWQSYITTGKKKDFVEKVKITRGKNKGKMREVSRWKEHLLYCAKKQFPELKPTKETADALLILHYARKNQLAR